MNDIPEPDPGTYVLIGQHLYQRPDEPDDGGPNYMVEMATDMYENWDDLVEQAKKHGYGITIVVPGEKLL